MKNLKSIGIIMLLLLTMTACGSSNNSENDNNADKVSEKSKIPYGSDIQKMFDNEQELVTFQPNSKQDIDYFVNHLEIEGYRFHSMVSRPTNAASSSNKAQYYYVTYEYVGESAEQTK